jgi:hypothetical protein
MRHPRYLQVNGLGSIYRFSIYECGDAQGQKRRPEQNQGCHRSVAVIYRLHFIVDGDRNRARDARDITANH